MTRPHLSASPLAPRLAAVLVDYDNLHQTFASRLNGRSYADELITELLDELRRYLLREDQTQAAMTLAYADFHTIDGAGTMVQRSLCQHEAEPRFVSSALQANATELQLCIEAVELARERPDVDVLVVVTGSRAYLPLLQRWRRYGRRALLVALDRPGALDKGSAFLDAASLLSEPSRRLLHAPPPGALPARRGPSRPQRRWPSRRHPPTTPTSRTRCCCAPWRSSKSTSASTTRSTSPRSCASCRSCSTSGRTTRRPS